VFLKFIIRRAWAYEFKCSCQIALAGCKNVTDGWTTPRSQISVAVANYTPKSIKQHNS